MFNDTVDILGTEYKVYIKTPEEDAKLNECNGYTDWTKKEICIGKFEPHVMSLQNQEAFLQKVLRHEIVHAFLFESGLTRDWAHNEDMVDWVAMQIEKINKAVSMCIKLGISG